MFEFIAANPEEMLDRMREWLSLAARFERQGKAKVADLIMQQAIACLETHITMSEASHA